MLRILFRRNSDSAPAVILEDVDCAESVSVEGGEDLVSSLGDDSGCEEDGSLVHKFRDVGEHTEDDIRNDVCADNVVSSYGDVRKEVALSALDVRKL